MNSGTIEGFKKNQKFECMQKCLSELNNFKLNKNPQRFGDAKRPGIREMKPINDFL